MTKKKAPKRAGITLRDVVVHMQSMEQRLTAKIEENTKDIKNVGNKTNSLSQRIDALERNLTARIDSVEKNLTERIDAAEEDLIATIKDTVKIRRHIGMAVADDA